MSSLDRATVSRLRILRLHLRYGIPLRFDPRILVLTAAIFLGTACSDGPTEAKPGPAADVADVSGNTQQGVVAQELSQPVVVEVKDAAGRLVPGQTVNFQVAAGGGSVAPLSAVTDAQGRAQARWTLGTVAADTQRLEASAIGATGGQALATATFTAVARADAPAHLTVVAGDSQVATAGEVVPDSLGVRVEDRFGNPVAGVAVVWAVTAGGGSLGAAQSVSDAQGVARVRWTLGQQRGPNVVTAQTAGAATVQLTAMGGLRYVALTAGEYHACALAAGGKAFCWGEANYHALGTGYQFGPQQCTVASCATTPVPVAGDHSFTKIAAGQAHTCAVDGAGQAFCWGYDDMKQSGACSQTVLCPTPTPIPSGTAFTSITAGSSHSCGEAAGRVYCWGRNAFGELGASDAGQKDCVRSPYYQGYTTCQMPVPIASAAPAGSLTAGADHTCALDAQGVAYCWGLNEDGRLGTVPTTTGCRGSASPSVCEPTPIVGFTFVQLSAGTRQTCGVTATHKGYCWGMIGVLSSFGQASCQTSPCSFSPAPVAGGLSFSSISAGTSQACGVTTDGDVYCWGNNPQGQLGDGTRNSSSVPVRVVSRVKFSAVTLGSGFTCALSTTGGIYCWGNNDMGTLGDASPIIGYVRGTPGRIAEPAI
jgi:alpha-tubulin suppressor-like RCC1 family protein